MLPVIREFMAAHQLPDVTVVADAGMVSEPNQKEIEAAGLSFILGQRIPETPWVVRYHTGTHHAVIRTRTVTRTRVVTKTVKAKAWLPCYETSNGLIFAGNQPGANVRNAVCIVTEPTYETAQKAAWS